MNPIALLLPFPVQIEGENFPSHPISSSEDFALFLTRGANLLKEKGNDPNGQNGQLANDPAPLMIPASLFSPVIAQEDGFLAASFLETQSTEKTLVTPIISGPKEDAILPMKEEETCTNSTPYALSLGKEPGNPNPSDAEGLRPGDLLPNLLPNQKNLISEIPLPKQPAGPEPARPEPSSSPVSPAGVPRPPSPIEGVPFISTPSQQTEPLPQDLILSQPQGTLTEAGFKSPHAFVSPSLDPSSTDPQLPDLQKPPLSIEYPSPDLQKLPPSVEYSSIDLQKPPTETANFTATEAPRPPERMTLGEENHLHPDGAFTVDLSNRELLIREAKTTGVEGVSSIVQKPPVFSQGRTDERVVAENLNRDPLPSVEKSPVPAQGGEDQSLMDKSVYEKSLEDGPARAREAVFSRDFPTHDPLPKDEKGNLLKEGSAFHQHAKAIEAMPQKTEKFAFEPEAPLTGERRGAMASFEQEGKTELWAKNEEACLPGTKEAENVDPSWMSAAPKTGAEVNHQATKEILEGQKELLPKTEYVEVFQQIAKKIVWSIRNNEEKIKLTLEPPELGHLYMEINREERNIRTTLWADNPTTKGLLEANQIQIYRIFEKEGFHLEKFNVFIHPESESFRDRGENSIEYGRWERGKYEEEKGTLSEEPFGINPVIHLPHRGSQYIDLFV